VSWPRRAKRKEIAGGKAEEIEEEKRLNFCFRAKALVVLEV
jgi:hypothetical protein